LQQPKLSCQFNENREAVEFYVKGFKTADLFPTFEQLSMIVDFHTQNRYKLSICETTVKKFVLQSKKSMVERQYFVQWMSEIYGLNLSSITMSSIAQPCVLDDQNNEIQTKLLSLLCLFYNCSPSALFSMQLFSVVYLKPNFCFKSHCGKYILVLPESYSIYMNRLVSDASTCEMKSCSKKNKDDQVRIFCYHNKNKLFGSALPKIAKLMKDIKETSLLKKNSFSFIYKDPLYYVRSFDKENLENESKFAAHIAYNTSEPIPQRILEAGVKLLSATDSLRVQNLFDQVFRLEKNSHISPSKDYLTYTEKFSFGKDSESPDISEDVTCNCGM
jgi:hypothetical protein